MTKVQGARDKLAQNAPFGSGSLPVGANRRSFSTESNIANY